MPNPQKRLREPNRSDSDSRKSDIGVTREPLVQRSATAKQFCDSHFTSRPTCGRLQVAAILRRRTTARTLSAREIAPTT